MVQTLDAELRGMEAHGKTPLHSPVVGDGLDLGVKDALLREEPGLMHKRRLMWSPPTGELRSQEFSLA